MSFIITPSILRSIAIQETFHLDEDVQEKREEDAWIQEESLPEPDNTDKIPSLMSLIVAKPDNDDDAAVDISLPKALEDVLALKDQRAAQELWMDDNSGSGLPGSVDFAEADADTDEEAGVEPKDDGQNLDEAKKKDRKLDKNRKKKMRKKQNRKQNKLAEKEKSVEKPDEGKEESATTATDGEDVEVEYVPEKITVADLAPMYRQFYRVFEIFKIEEPKVISNEPKSAELLAAEKAALAINVKGMEKNDKDDDYDDDDDDIELENGGDKDKMSKRKMKKLNRSSVAELKQIVNRPDVVEMHDVTARDPQLLVQLKAHRNTVQVPRHWCFKRKYLQGKRGIEKPPFDLPAFIKKTGIMEMRASLQVKFCVYSWCSSLGTLQSPEKCIQRWV